jgi:hypothetical protein
MAPAGWPECGLEFLSVGDGRELGEAVDATGDLLHDPPPGHVEDRVVVDPRGAYFPYRKVSALVLR